MTPTTTADRIADLFARCRAENRAALILYLTSGFPDEATTRRLLPVLAEAGADLIELGVPFSDPIADGPVIQKASTVALERGMTLEKTLGILKDFRAGHGTPTILFGAWNPFLRRGTERVVADAAAAGADGFLVPDLPVEEAAVMREACRRAGLHFVAFIAPTTPDARMAMIARHGTGFLYCFAIKGITGMRAAVADTVFPYLERIGRQAKLPRALGFGIGTPEHVAAVAPHCEGVVVGSALISLIERCFAEGRDLEREVGAYVRSLAAAARRA